VPEGYNISVGKIFDVQAGIFLSTEKYYKISVVSK
jgi:hypothetical protein